MSESLSAQAIKEIERLAVENKKVRFHKPDTPEPGDVYFVETADNRLERHIAEQLREYELCGPEEFARFAVENYDPEKKSSIVFYDENGLTFFFDESDRRERARCQLTFSEQFRWLFGNSSARFQQRDFLNVLRITFHGCRPEGSDIVRTLRDLKWSNHSETGGSLQHGQESLGSHIEARVTTQSNIPEEILLTIPIWQEFGVTHPVLCAIDISVADRTFRLVPFPQQLEMAVESGLDAIAELLNHSSIPKVYRGRP